MHVTVHQILSQIHNYTLSSPLFLPSLESPRLLFLNFLSFALSANLLLMIFSFPFINNHMQDKQVWISNKSGLCTTRSIYQNLLHTSLDSSPSAQLLQNFNFIWSLPAPPKIQTYFWLVYHDRIACKHLLITRHILQHNLCHEFSLPETALNIFCDCPTAQSYWSQVFSIFPFLSAYFMHACSFSSISDWIHYFCALKILLPYDIRFSSFFATSCWHLWLYRNRLIFPLSQIPPKPPSIFLFSLIFLSIQMALLFLITLISLDLLLYYI